MPTSATTPGDAEQVKKSKPFFERARTLAEIGSYDDAIEMYVQGLGFAPNDLEAHKAMRDISLLRKANGGKGLGFLEKRKLPKASDDKQTMLNSEKLLAYDPANTEHMAAIARAASAAGYTATAQWMEEVLRRTLP
jgi:hypothetical protein